MKSDISKYIADEKMTVVDAMKQIDENARGIVFIVKEGRLAGSLTDGDIRRYIIKSGDLADPVSSVMNRKPKFVFESDIENAAQIMKVKKVDSVPVIDTDRRIIDVLFSSETYKHSVNNKALSGTPVIIMAGGKGTRLYPFTKILPKPLIPIGDVPILERIINRFNSYGADDFYLTVNYKKEIIKSYFKELAHDYSITYVEEDKPLGTAGSIKLINKAFDRPIIITNCDILIEADYEKILKYHNESKNAMTIVSSLRNITIPYGVLHSAENGKITSMEEKPQLSYFINTGMYVLEPQYVELIPDDTFYHMPSLAEQLIAKGLNVGMYPISENSFLDMGEFEEMKKMEARVHSGEIQ